MADLDPEICAMSKVYQLLSDLNDKEAQNRVLSWVCQRLELSSPSTSSIDNNVSTPSNSANENSNQSVARYESVADIFSIANPKTDTEKVLITAAFLQEKLGLSDLSARDINRELHNLGHKVTNITATIGRLSNKKPQLMIQTKKSGKSQQAKKKYKVTTAGFDMLKEILNS